MEENIIEAIKDGSIVEAIEPVYDKLKPETQDFFLKAYFEEPL